LRKLATLNQVLCHRTLQEGRVRFLQFIAIACLAFLCAVAPAHADKRVALVVGNGAYRQSGVPKLDNSVNDARGMREALKGLGFDVLYGEDLDLKGLQGLIGRFADRVDGADVAIVYFAGHGATFGDTPYVVPVDAAFSSLRQVPYELVAVETLIGELRQAKGVRIAILDACRDNGAERDLKRQAARGGEVSRGLAPMKNPSGLIIAYATQYGATAADDVAGASAASLHSPFTTALLNNIAAPGLDVTEMFRKVGREVNAATGGTQKPEISISMYEQYALAPGAAKPMAVAPRPAEVTPPGGNAAGADAAPVWRDIQNTTSLAVLDDFIRQFGHAPIYGPLARTRREELTKEHSRMPDKDPATEPAKPVAGPQTALVAPPEKPAVPADVPCMGLSTVSSPPRCVAPLTAEQERGLKPKDSFRECESCPEMMVLPAGSFTMGSPKTEKGRADDEGPQHVVTIRNPFAVGKLHVTVDQFAAFIREIGHDTDSGCFMYIGRSWRNPGFAQDGSHPVVCVSWDDAKAYVDWLTKKTGKPYRLLSEAEWEYAARGRTSRGAYPRFWFGNDEKELCRYGNFKDQKAENKDASCDDGYAKTSPAGHYEPNAFGLYDMFGNVWQFAEDCYHSNYNRAPADGTAWIGGDCKKHVVRGGSWDDDPDNLRAAYREDEEDVLDFGFGTVKTNENLGFRVARTLVR
jgi:formylglycine-generating enzyme required for sulfatase activity